MTNHQLRTVLAADAATCLASGILMSSLATPLSRLLSIPSSLLLYAGIILLPIAAFIAVTVWSNPPRILAVWVVIIGNMVWIAGSLWLMLGNMISPNGLGLAYLAAQSAAVAILTWLEGKGVTRLTVSAEDQVGRAV